MINLLEYPYSYKCPFCNRQIFFFKQKPTEGQKVDASLIYFEDGTQPKPGDPIKCSRVQCGAKLGGLYTRFVQETQMPKI